MHGYTLIFLRGSYDSRFGGQRGIMERKRIGEALYGTYVNERSSRIAAIKSARYLRDNVTPHYVCVVL